MANENEQQQHFTFTIAVLFTLNYIMGTGFLTIPWSFNQSGVILGLKNRTLLFYLFLFILLIFFSFFLLLAQSLSLSLFLSINFLY